MFFCYFLCSPFFSFPINDDEKIMKIHKMKWEKKDEKNLFFIYFLHPRKGFQAFKFMYLCGALVWDCVRRDTKKSWKDIEGMTNILWRLSTFVALWDDFWRISSQNFSGVFTSNVNKIWKYEYDMTATLFNNSKSRFGNWFFPLLAAIV